MPLGADVTCTITNTDNTPTLKLVKVVTNNDGGTAVADDWTLSATAAAPNDGRNFNSRAATPSSKRVRRRGLHPGREPEPGHRLQHHR